MKQQPDLIADLKIAHHKTPTRATTFKWWRLQIRWGSDLEAFCASVMLDGGGEVEYGGLGGDGVSDSAVLCGAAKLDGEEVAERDKRRGSDRRCCVPQHSLMEKKKLNGDRHGGKGAVTEARDDGWRKKFFLGWSEYFPLFQQSIKVR